MIIVPEFVILHHSLTKDGITVSWGAIRDWHTGIHPDSPLDYDDIGYQFGIELINKAYEILVGRMMDQHGAHCYQEGMNKRSIGICFVGNFDIKPPNQEMWDKGLNLVRSLMRVFNIPEENIRGHRDYATYKTCPGAKFDLNLFRSEL